MKNKTKLSFQPPSWKKLQIMQIFPTATVAVAEGLKSLATAVELRPLVQHWFFGSNHEIARNLHTKVKLEMQNDEIAGIWNSEIMKCRDPL